MFIPAAQSYVTAKPYVFVTCLKRSVHDGTCQDFLPLTREPSVKLNLSPSAWKSINWKSCTPPNKEGEGKQETA